VTCICPITLLGACCYSLMPEMHLGNFTSVGFRRGLALNLHIVVKCIFCFVLFVNKLGSPSKFETLVFIDIAANKLKTRVEEDWILRMTALVLFYCTMNAPSYNIFYFTSLCSKGR